VSSLAVHSIAFNLQSPHVGNGFPKLNLSSQPRFASVQSLIIFLSSNLYVFPIDVKNTAAWLTGIQGQCSVRNDLPGKAEGQEELNFTPFPLRFLHLGLDKLCLLPWNVV